MEVSAVVFDEVSSKLIVVCFEEIGWQKIE
jgi:hypothetical protein